MVEADLKGAPYDKKLLWKTPEGITVKPLYSREDLKLASKVSTKPGEAPYLRGTSIGNRCKVRQEFSAKDSPSALNVAIRAAIAQNVDSIGIELTSDVTLAEAREILSGVELSQIEINFRYLGDSLPALALLESLRSGASISGSIESDPLVDLLKFGRIEGSLPGR